MKKVLLDQAKQALQVLLTKEDLGENKAFDLLKTALADEFKILLKRIFLLLSFLYDAPAIMGAERNLLSGIKTQVGLALELLDVTLSKELKGYIFPLLDENTPLKKRIHELKTLLNLRNMDQGDRLREIITNEDTRRMDWTSACGISAAAVLGLRNLVGVIEGAIGRSDLIVRETAAWALFKLDPDTYRKYSDALLKDPNPRIAELAARFQKHF